MSKPKISPQAGPPALSQINRGYNARMRDTYFAKTQGHFGALSVTLLERSPAGAMGSLDDASRAAATTLEFAREAVSGVHRHKAHQLPGAPAFFKEEILFIHLLEELHASCLFLRARLSTTQELGRYRQKIRALIRSPHGRGYLSQILQLIEVKSKTDKTEIRQILRLIQERLALGSRIFDIIRIRKG